MLARKRRRSQVAVNAAQPVNWGHPLNSGLLHWWGAVPNSGWQGGSLLRDAVRGTKSPLDGTLVNSPKWSFSQSGNTVRSLNFVGGSAQYVDCGVAIPAGSTNMTFCGWVYRASASDICVFGNYHSNTRFNILLYSDGNIYFQAGNSGTAYGFIAFSATGWHHYALVYDGSLAAWARVIPYIDGVTSSWAGTAGTPDASISSDNFRIGSEENSTRYSTGNHANTQIFSRTLTAASIRRIYREGRLGNPNTLNWVGTKTYSFKAAAAAGGFKAAWAAGRTKRVIGSGVL